MKRFILLTLAVLAVTFASCSDDETTSYNGWFDSARVEHVSATSAKVVCSTSYEEGVLATAEAGFYFTAENGDELLKTDDCRIEGRTISAYLKGLTPNTTYRVFPFVVLNGTQMNGVDFMLTTSAEGVDPVLTITSDKKITVPFEGGEFELAYTLENPVEEVSIEVETEADWISGFKVEDGKVLFSVAENKSVLRSAQIALKYDWFEPQMVEVGQQGAPIDVDPSENPVYGNNFDKAPVAKGSTGWPYLDETDAWKNHTGSGAGNVSYEFSGMSVRRSETMSAGYAGASGMNKLFFGKMPAEFSVKDISIAASRKLRLTFGVNYNNMVSGAHEFPEDKFILTMGNGSGWSGAVAYRKLGGDDGVDPYWVRCVVDFTLPDNVSSLTLKFEAKEALVFSMDDLVLEEGEGGMLISFDGEAPQPQPDPQPEGTTIASVIAGGANQTVEVSGQVVAKHERGFLIQDATGILYIYEVTDAKIGDYVKVSGVTSEYGKMIQLGKGTSIEKTKDGEFTQPVPTAWNAAKIDSYCQGESPLSIDYIKYTGVLTMQENSKHPGSYYYNVKVDGATATGSIVNPLEGMVDPAWNNKTITVTGYTVGVSGRDNQFFNVMATKVEEGNGGETPEPQPEPSVEPKFGTPRFENVTETSADILCSAEFASIADAKVYFMLRQPDGSLKREVKPQVEGNLYKAQVGGLIPATVYEFELCIEFGGKTFKSGIGKFTTKKQGGGEVPGVDSNTKYKGWAELPNEDLAKKNNEYFYAYHLCPDIYAGGNKARNFTACYSKSKICPVWVAAPLHVSYAGSGRHDAYKPDPDIHCEQNGKWSGYTRGHMLGSAERNRTVATNHQVFYFSNIAPQLQTYFNTGGGQWNTAEDWVDLQWRNSNDTCYQVVGCYWENHGKVVKGTEIPSHYYTVLLKAKKGVKKWVGDCTADELQTICIWVRHKTYSKSEVVRPNNFESKGMFKTVEEVERLTGHKFFTNVPNAPKKSFNTRDWNF